MSTKSFTRFYSFKVLIIFIRGFHPYILYKGDNVLCKSPHYFENEVSDEDDLNPDFKIHKKNYIRFFLTFITTSIM